MWRQKILSLTMKMNTKMHFYSFVVLFIFNLFDAFATFHWVTIGAAKELNPIAAYLLAVDPVLFLVVKCFLGSLSLVVLWLLRQEYPRIIQIVSVIWFIVYLLIMAFHIKFILDYFVIV